MIKSVEFGNNGFLPYESHLATVNQKKKYSESSS